MIKGQGLEKCKPANRLPLWGKGTSCLSFVLVCFAHSACCLLFTVYTEYPTGEPVCRLGNLGT